MSQMWCEETDEGNMSSKQYGLQKERQVKKMLEQAGALYVTRCRGSFTAYDVQAFFPDNCRLISVKATQQKYFAFNSELLKLSKIKLPIYCSGELWVYLSPRADRETKGWVITNVEDYKPKPKRGKQDE